MLRASRNAGADSGRLALEIWALAHGAATLMLGGYLPAQGGADAYGLLESGVRALVDGAQVQSGASGSRAGGGPTLPEMWNNLPFGALSHTTRS